MLMYSEPRKIETESGNSRQLLFDSQFTTLSIEFLVPGNTSLVLH